MVHFNYWYNECLNYLGIEIKNKKQVAVHLIVKDAVPVSSEEKVRYEDCFAHCTCYFTTGHRFQLAILFGYSI